MENITRNGSETTREEIKNKKENIIRELGKSLATMTCFVFIFSFFLSSFLSSSSFVLFYQQIPYD